jgi:CRISPR system Cascade subunit CasB
VSVDLKTTEPNDVSPKPRSRVAPGRYRPIYELVSARAQLLQGAYMRGESGATATLARLRRAVGTKPGVDPFVWQETLGLPAQFVGVGDEPSAFENAVHHAITLFALHQQSQGSPMHRADYSIGRSTRQLGQTSASEEAVLRRFHALGTASSLAEAVTHARGLITQFRSEAIPLDYGLFAVDLIKLQDTRQINGVRLSWGRDYYRMSDRKSLQQTDTNPQTPTAKNDEQIGEKS